MARRLCSSRAQAVKFEQVKQGIGAAEADLP